MYYRKVTGYISTREVEDRTIFTRYSVIVSEVEVFNGKEQVKLPSYGIEVLEEVFEGEKRVEVVEEKVANVSPYFEKVDKLAQLFKEMQVSPIHLPEILDDMWEDLIRDYDIQVKLHKVAI
ncbi:MAG: hypothetical protein IMW83_03505 [Caldanaerobacter subterraneus]|nr:hypothetical protein [Caldanaerobacter subterraneus]